MNRCSGITVEFLSAIQGHTEVFVKETDPSERAALAEQVKARIQKGHAVFLIQNGETRMVKDYDAALAAANATPFGLCAGICTRSLKYAEDFKRNADVGMVMVNLPTAGVDYHVPFGGRKGSSYGSREQGRYAVEFYTTVKTAYVNAG